MIEAMISFLVEEDSFFLRFWSKLNETQKLGFVKQNQIIQNKVKEQSSYLLDKHAFVHNYLKRYLVQIQTKDFEYSRVPEDWNKFTNNSKEKNEFYEFSLLELKNFLERFFPSEKIELYGGVKSQSSIMQKKTRNEKSSSPRFIEYLVLDLVRLRIVAKDLTMLRDLGIRIWQFYYDQVVECRNFYIWPKLGVVNSPYRAIHFNLELSPGRLVEIQVMTQTREMVSYLDYYLVFKNQKPENSNQFKDWISQHSLKANIYEYTKLLNEEKDKLVWIPFFTI